MKRRYSHGISLLGLIVSTTIVGISLFYFTRGLTHSKKLEKMARQTLTAEYFAAELIEFFRAMETSDRLKTYLSTNPINNAINPYFLCSHINILNRQTAEVFNRDPLAAIPPSILDRPDASEKANRYYQVFVINAETLQLNQLRCDQRPDTAPALADNERFLVLVGVSWISPVGIKKVNLSTMLTG